MSNNIKNFYSFVNESEQELKQAHDEYHQGQDDVELSIANAERIAELANEIKSAIQDKKDIPAWMQDKISKAVQSLEDIANFSKSE